MRKKLLSISTNKLKITMIFCLAVLLNVGLMNGQTDIAVNGDFETGDFTTGWTQFPSGVQTIETTNPSEGTYCARLNNTVPASASIIKNANVGVGTAVGGQEVTITFDARGTTAIGGVTSIELFSELSGGGTSKSENLGAFDLDADPNTWKSFSYTTTLGPDVSGGVTLQLGAITGGAAGSLADVFYDNVKITLTDVAPSARVQVIHNSPDDAAALVDVYLDGALLLDDFAFRTASPFVDAPAGVEIDIDIAPSTSSSVSESIANFKYTLADGETYVIVADGITGLSGTTYTPAPAFGLEVYAMGREAAATAGNTDLLVHHGSTDAPTVDVNEVSGPLVLVDNISYGEFDPNGYLELLTADYTINISTADGLTVVAEYDAPLATLGLDDAAAVVVASGFLDPAANGNGPAFGLWVALPAGGALVELPPGGSTPTEPTVSAPAPTLPQSEVLSVYSDTYTTGVTNFDFIDFNGSGTYSQVEIEGVGTGNFSGKIEGLSFYGPSFDPIDLSAESAPGVSLYDYVHFDYYATTSTLIQFYVIDADTPCCGSPEEPRYVISPSGGDEVLEQGVWKSVFIPFTVFSNFAANNGAQWDGNPVSQLKFEGNGNLYFDNIYFSKNTSLSTTDFKIAGLSAYPNPTQNNWTVKTKNIKMSSIQVFDMLGKSVMSLKPDTTEATIDASGLKSGLYFAKISTANGTSSLKLVKQ
jgi:hypothetical protein